MFSSTITYNGEEMQANTLDYNYRIEFIDNVVTEDNEITSMVATLDNKELEVQDMGSYWTIKENNSTTLKYNQIYILNVQAIVNGNEEEIEEKVIFVPPGTTISGGVITSIPSGDYSFSTENATNQIIENQQQQTSDIVSSINNIIGSLPTSYSSGDISGSASGDLSSGFDGGSGILGGIFGLFVPDGTFFKNYFSELSNFFSDRLGIIYFPFEFIIDFFNRVLSIDFSEPIMVLGPYTLPLNDDFELVPQITFDFNSYLEEPHLKSIHDVYLVIMDGLLIFGYIQLLRKTYEKMVNKGG